MSDKTNKEYTNGEVTIVWKNSLCAHSGLCVKGLSKVFRPQERPWINMDGVATEKIIQQVKKCPSQALSYYMNEEQNNKKENSWDPTPLDEDQPNVEIRANGPLMIYGDIKVKDKDGTLIHKTKATAFCRCGASTNKPFCDGAHKSIIFDD